MSLLAENVKPTVPEHQLQPLVSIILPVYNCSQMLYLTMDSIISQEYPRCEVIVIDAGSTDRTVEEVHSYRLSVNLLSVLKYNLYHMINLGITAARGEYVNILFPGDFYLNTCTLQDMMMLAVENGKPDLVYCGTLLRDQSTGAKFLFRSFNLSLLKRGQQPTSLQACWFKREIFEKIGPFKAEYQQRGGFDLLCRFCMDLSLTHSSLKRALVDYDLRWVTSAMVIKHFYETAAILSSHFGWRAVLEWLCRQKDIKRFAKLWTKQLVYAFREKGRR